MDAGTGLRSGVRNGVPVLERTLDMLAILERDPEGATIRGLTGELGLPRSTVYRILNTLLVRRIVRRSSDGVFSLGPRLVSLATRVRMDPASYDLTELALPLMQQLRDEVGEPVKLSVRDGDRAKVVAALLGRYEYSPAPATGTSYPLHAGAASKIIMAYMSPADLDRHLSAPLTRYTPRTITDPARLRSDLAKIRRQNFAHDLGEHNVSVHAVAAPVLDPAGRFLAALSIPFLADKDTATREKLRHGVITTAAAISARIPRP
jgi:DNA-binding IclR family transcriptional regulator